MLYIIIDYIFFFSIVCSLYRTQLEFICARARTEMKRKTNNRLQHLLRARAFHLPLASRPSIVCYRAKSLNEGKNVTENDVSVWLVSFFSLAAENWKRKRTERQIEL
jgi:hypothetical protein